MSMTLAPLLLDKLVTGVNAKDPGRLVKKRNAVIGRPRAATKKFPHEKVWVTVTGGRQSIPYLRGSEDPHAPSERYFGTERKPNAQVRIRSGQGKNARELSEQLAWFVVDALDQIRDVSAGLCECRVLQGAPNDLGRDEQGHHEWSINIETTFDI